MLRLKEVPCSGVSGCVRKKGERKEWVGNPWGLDSWPPKIWGSIVSAFPGRPPLVGRNPEAKWHFKRLSLGNAWPEAKGADSEGA